MGPGGTRNIDRFPWRTGNRFELLIDGPAFFARMLAAVAGARRYVFLELYLVESGTVAAQFVAELAAAARRGAACPAAAACEVGFEIFRRERNTCGNPVDRDADLRPVRLPPDGEPEIVSENIHGVQILIFSRSSKNPG